MSERTNSNDVALFARTDFRDSDKVFGIKEADRRAHMYVIGKTGTGKTTLLETLIVEDLQAGRGLALLDPHGDLVERVLRRMPEDRRRDVIYLNVPDPDLKLAFNPLEPVAPDRRMLAASGILEAFQKLWPKYWGPRMEHLLRNALLALLEMPAATMADILRIMSDTDFRRQVARQVTNGPVREFWLQEFEQYTKAFRTEAIAPVQNKIGAFLANEYLHRILVQPRSSFDFRKVMDEGKILLVNLAKGRLGEESAALLGSLLVSHLELVGLSRADIPEQARRDFYIYLDEFHTFTTLSVATMLSELRKYRVNLILAHQYLAQLEPQVRDAVLGNVGTLVSFRLGPEDARILAHELAPQFAPTHLMALPNFHIYLKLMIDGTPSQPFSARTLHPEAARMPPY
jgi:type IV secretory pathway TraG/TraD family ATPase VirD4